MNRMLGAVEMNVAEGSEAEGDRSLWLLGHVARPHPRP